MPNKQNAKGFEGDLLYDAISEWLGEFHDAVFSERSLSNGCINGAEGRWVGLEYSVGDRVVMLLIWAETDARGIPIPAGMRLEGTQDEVRQQLNAWRQAKGPGW